MFYASTYGGFAETVGSLGDELEPETESYYYAVDHVGEFEAHMTATPKSPDLRSYVASAFIIEHRDSEVAVMIVCESDAPSQPPPDWPPIPDTIDDLDCPPGSSRV